VKQKIAMVALLKKRHVVFLLCTAHAQEVLPLLCLVRVVYDYFSIGKHCLFLFKTEPIIFFKKDTLYFR